MSSRSIALLSLCLVVSSCSNTKIGDDNDQVNYPFTGNWQGNGKDSEGNGFTFAGRVMHSGVNRYRIMILDKLDTLKEPIHIMDGVLENNRFIYTADNGLYEGEGMLNKDMFEGFYKGPVDGTYTMWRINNETGSK
ncbi:MAG: hypothetical protein JW927_18705 [Deltaproteobacteria bacterium]|nr:hypothetical protein [Deltaproteobacteria bacterium]